MTHCLHCGHALEGKATWPRLCDGCGSWNYNSPKPVVALVLRSWRPPDDPRPPIPGVVVIKRGIEPYKGSWAFPGGYIDHAEDWRQAASRECHEEIGFKPEPGHIQLLDVVSTFTNHLVLFVTAPEILSSQDWWLTGDTNDRGETEILDIDVWNSTDQGTRHLGVPSHDRFFQKMGFSRLTQK